MQITPSQQHGAIGENIVERCFLSDGWIVHRCIPDYGFDFLVCPSRGGTVSTDYAFLQVKSVSSPLSVLVDGTIPFRIETKHLELWQQTATPSYLCVVELPTERIFLSRTWHLTDFVDDVHGRGWEKKHDSYTVHLSNDMLVQGDRLLRMTKALEETWERIRYVLSDKFQPSPDAGCTGRQRPPLRGIESEIARALGAKMTSELYIPAGTGLRG